MPQKFDCAITVQLLCNYKLMKDRFYRTSRISASLVNRHIPPDDAVQMRRKCGANAVQTKCSVSADGVQMYMCSVKTQKHHKHGHSDNRGHVTGYPHIADRSI